MESTTQVTNGTNDTISKIPYALAYGELVFASVIYIIIIIVGIIGNTMIILSVILAKNLRTSTNAFVVSLSVCDLIKCLFLPWQVVALLGRNGWALPQAEWLCGVTALVIYIGTGISLYNLAAIAINRLIYLVFSFRYIVLYRPWKIAGMIAFVWLFPASIFIGMILAGIGSLGYETVDYPSCSDIDDVPNADIFNIAQTVIAFPLPMIIIIICYTWIYIHIRRHFMRKRDRETELNRYYANTIGSTETLNQSNENLDEITREELEITKYLFFVVLAFVACFLPLFAGNAVPNSGHLNFYTALPTVANSGINFFIYASRHPQFKVVLRCMIRCQYSEISKPSRFVQSRETTVSTTTGVTDRGTTVSTTTGVTDRGTTVSTTTGVTDRGTTSSTTAGVTDT